MDCEQGFLGGKILTETVPQFPTVNCHVYLFIPNKCYFKPYSLMGCLLCINGPGSHVYGNFSLAPYWKLENKENNLACYRDYKDICLLFTKTMIL